MAAREVLAGAVLDVHQRAEGEAKVTLLTTAKSCTGCAHYVEAKPWALCARTVKHHPVTGAAAHDDCISQRCDSSACGKQAVHFVPTADFLAARSARRLVQQERIEEAIKQFNPDVNAAQQILDALVTSVRARYGDAATLDFCERAQEAREALDEIES